MATNMNQITNSIELLKAYAINDDQIDYKVVLGVVFSKNKLATKKKNKAEENLLAELSRNAVFFPHKFGKSPTIALFTLKSLPTMTGIDYVGSENLVKDIQNNVVIPNYLLCFRDEMPLLSKYSRILGPKGLMPTPKQGTVVEEDNIKRVIEDLKKGSLKIKINKNLMTQIPVGTTNMGKDALYENINCILTHINSHLPVSFLKTNLRNVYLTSTQGPSVEVNV